MIELLVSAQRWIYETISAYLATFATSGDWSELLSVVPMGIIFGAIHAMTPGHSKSVLASYLVGSRLALFRGFLVSTVLAATHVISAVVIALFASELMTRTMVGAGRAPAIENLSRSLLILIGIWFVIRAFRGQTRHPKREGLAVGFIAGLIPCPLTLFVMVLALSRGVPEAGIAFAASMMMGVALTLALIAAIAIIGRDILSGRLQRAGTSVAIIARSLDGLAGLLLISFGVLELYR